MVRRLLALFLLVNVIGVVANLPRIIAALDGAAIGSRVSEWVVGVSTATGDLVDEAAADPLSPEEVASIQEALRQDELTDPLDDESVAALVELWRVLEEAGATLQAEELRDLLLEEGVDPDAEGVDLDTTATSGPVPTVTARPTHLDAPLDDQDEPTDPAADDGRELDLDETMFDDERSRSALEALESGDGLGDG